MLLLLLALLLLLTPSQGLAEEEPDDEDQTLSLPFGFYNDQFGVGAGWVEGRIGFPQPQASLLGSVMAGSEGTGMVFVMGRDIQLPGLDRMFVDPILFSPNK